MSEPDAPDAPAPVDDEGLTELVKETLSYIGIEPTLYRARAQTPAATSDSWRTGFGHYSEMEEVNHGGGGVIFRATDRKANRVVAIKVLAERHHGSRRLLNKFLAEAQITAQLQHPNIVPVHEIGLTPGGQPFFSMNHVEGESLAKLLMMLGAAVGRNDNSLSRLLGIFCKICDALSFAHSKRVIHRDLKPENIVIGQFGEVLVLDWGLARVLDSADSSRIPVQPDPSCLLGDAATPLDPTGDGTIEGTPTYMSPEQAFGEQTQIDYRSDIYSLGAILYELLTLERPFLGASIKEILDQVRVGKFVSPTERTPLRHVPRELAAVTMKAMHFKPAERYQSVAELQDEVQAYLQGRTLTAVSYTPWQRAAKWLARHRMASLVGLILLVASVMVPLLIEIRQRTALLRSEAVVVTEVQRLHRRLSQQQASLAVFGDSETARLVQPNQELVSQRVDAWYAAHAKIAGTLDLLAALERRTRTPRARELLRLTWVRQQRQQLCRKIWRQATRLGHYSLARSWVGRAADVGFDTEAQEAALAEIDQARQARDERTLTRARQVLDEVARLESRPGDVREWFDSSVYRLVRLRCPALVRLLLQPRHLDSKIEWVRLVVIQTLGRIGDLHTRGADKRDTVEALCARLEQIDLRSQLNVAIALGQSLGHLADARAYTVLRRRRIEALWGGSAVFTQRTAVAMARIPPPAGTQSLLSSKAWYERGATHQDRAEHRKAIACFSQAIQANPTLLQAYLVRGVSHYKLNQLAEAVRDFTQVIRASPDTQPAYVNRGEAYRRLGKLAEALLDLNQAIHLNSKSVSGWSNRGSVWLDRKQYKLALADFEQALRLDPAHPVSLSGRGVARFALRDYQKGMADLARAIKLRPEDPRFPLTLAQMNDQRRDYARAMTHVNQALRLDPKLAKGYQTRGIIRSKQGDWQQARADLLQAKRLRGSLRMIDQNLCQVYQRLGQWDLARSACRLAIKAHPEAADPYYSAARIQIHDGQYKAALASVQLALDRDARHPGAYEAMADCYRFLGQPKKALEAQSMLITLQPRVSGAYAKRGSMLAELAQFPAALRDMDAAISLDPTAGRSWTNRAYIKQRLGDLAGALVDINRALKLNGTNPIDLDHRGNIQQSMRQPRAAIASYDQAIRANPRFALAYNHRANARFIIGDRKGAWSDYRMAIKLEPNVAVHRINRGAARTQARQLKGALEDYDVAIRLAPRYTTAYYNRALLRSRMGDLKGMLADYRMIRKLLPRDWRYSLTLGRLFAKHGKRALAIEIIETAHGLAPPGEKARIRQILTQLRKDK